MLFKFTSFNTHNRIVSPTLRLVGKEWLSIDDIISI